MTSEHHIPNPPVSLPLLDTMRGLLALFVLLGHSANKLGFGPSGALWVDFFMILSGFLMVHHAFLRETKEPIGSAKMARAFYLRRFFRIAPVYYVLLTVFFAGWWPLVRDSAPFPVKNAALHLSFLFGFVPDGGGPTGMPDWSIGLEMQFYAVFPLLVWIMWRCGPEWLCLGSALVVIIAYRLWGVYAIDQPGPLGLFVQPSFLAFNISLFAMGMTTAWLWWKYPAGGRRWAIAAVCAATGSIAFEHLHAYISMGVVVSALLLRSVSTTRVLLDKVLACANMLSDKPVWKWMATLSYTLYLCHMMVLMITGPWVKALGLSLMASWCILATVTTIASYSLGVLLHLTVEKPMILWAKRLA